MKNINPETNRPPLSPEKSTPQESLKNKHFPYTIVFGQGPVQEETIPRSGREGLNKYSRLLSLSASQMLKEGITDKVILTGGATGVRKGTPEASTEADLMADIIRRKLTSLSEDGLAYVANGRKVEIYDEAGKRRPREEIREEIKDAFKDKILIENEAQDTLENFSYVINKYIGSNSTQDEVAMLGIGFHAHDTYNGTGAGRLAVLADIFGMQASIYSAEDVIKQLISTRTKSPESTRKILQRLADNVSYETEHGDVAQLKSLQETLLIEGLKKGEWIRAVPFINDLDRVKGMITGNAFIVGEIQKQTGTDPEELKKLTGEELIDLVGKIKVQGTPQVYGEIKSAIFDVLENMGLLSQYGKGTIPESPKEN